MPDTGNISAVTGEVARQIDFSGGRLNTGIGARSGNGVASHGPAGRLVYGPYLSMGAGRYLLRCHCGPGGHGAGSLHVWHRLGTRPIAACPLEAGGVTELPFTLAAEVSDIEFVVDVESGTACHFRHFTVEKGGVPVPPGGRPALRDDFGGLLPFRHVRSLGTHCYSAALLQRQALKRFSGPFDWIFASPEMVIHCLEDRFETLLDRSQFEPVPVADRPDPDYYRCHHRFYRDRFGVPYVFNHHDVWTDEGHAYLTRCVDRFLAVAEGPEPVLLFQSRREDERAARDFAGMAACVSRHLPACALTSMAVAAGASAGLVPEVRLLERQGQHTLFRYTPLDEWEATVFRQPVDEAVLGWVLRQHGLNLA